MVELFWLVYDRHDLAKPIRSIVRFERELVHRCRPNFDTLWASMAADRGSSRVERSVRALGALAVAFAGLALTACGGGDGARTTRPAVTTKRPAATPAELDWERTVDRFAAAVATDLGRLQTLTGGGPKAGPIGPRPVTQLFAEGPARQRFEETTAALARCRNDLDGLVPAPPTRRLQPVRVALRTACSGLASAAASLTKTVRRAGSPREVDPGSLALARGQAREGLRLLVDALAILLRVVGARR
jgi:hypothetical protein